MASPVVPPGPSVQVLPLRGLRAREDPLRDLATKVTEVAFAGGIGNVPTPITEQDWDGWLYWTPISVHVQDAADPGLGRGSTQIVEVDSKAMRKFDEGDTLMAVIELVEVGTATGDIWFDSRALFLLS